MAEQRLGAEHVQRLAEREADLGSEEASVYFKRAFQTTNNLVVHYSTVQYSSHSFSECDSEGLKTYQAPAHI